MAAIQCPSCAKELNVPQQYAGKKVRCPNCQGVLSVPPLEATEALEEVSPITPQPRRPAMPPLPEEERPIARRPVGRRTTTIDRGAGLRWTRITTGRGAAAARNGRPVPTAATTTRRASAGPFGAA